MKFLRVILVLSLLAILPWLVLPDGIWRDVAFLAAILAVASGIIVLRGAERAQPPRTPRPKRRRKGRPIVVDGSNVMHWQDGVVALTPLTEVIGQLKELGYVPGVVFDANAGWKLQGRYLHDSDLARLLGLETRQVLVVPKGTQADTYLLETAQEFGVRIVTNDRFRDWAEAHPQVLEPGFLIRGGMREGRAWLKGLDARKDAL